MEMELEVLAKVKLYSITTTLQFLLWNNVKTPNSIAHEYSTMFVMRIKYRIGLNLLADQIK